MIICPACQEEVPPEVNPDGEAVCHEHRHETLFFNHTCKNQILYPNFWGYFSKQSLLPTELLLNFKAVQFYYEMTDNAWEVQLDHHDNITTLASGFGRLSLDQAYKLLKRYEKLVVFA